jgi:hypothetical protein
VWVSHLKHVRIIRIRQQVFLLPPPLGRPAGAGFAGALALGPRHVPHRINALSSMVFLSRELT